jgi:hypothetical protein
VRNAATLLRAKPDGHAAPMPQACYSGRPMHRSASQNRRRRRPSFKPVLIEVLRTGYLSAADKVHIRKWMNSEAANDFIPDKVVADPIIRKDIISYALHARQIAEAARHGDDLLRRERQQQRDELLALTKKSEDLAAYFRSVEQYSGIAAFFQRFFCRCGACGCCTSTRQNCYVRELRESRHRPLSSAAKPVVGKQRGDVRGLENTTHSLCSWSCA